MNLFNKILVPVDFSSLSHESIERAVKIATLCGSKEIQLLSVVDINNLGYFVTTEMCLPIEYNHFNANLVEAGKKMEALTAGLNHVHVEGITVTGKILEGNFFRVIRDYVAENYIDLVVMGTHGTGGIREFVFGSHAQEIVTSVNCPVLSLQPSDQHDNIKKMIVPVESFYPGKKLYFAIQLAKIFDAEIHLVSQVNQLHSSVKMTFTILFRVTEVLDKEKIRYKVFASEDKNITEAMLAYAEKESIDLILVNPGNESKLTGKFIETTGGYIVNHAHVPVLSVKRNV